MDTPLLDYREAVDGALIDLRRRLILPRIAAHDHTVWQADPTEITNRLGWLDSPAAMFNELPALQTLVEGVRADGYTDVLLLGMGGSSLAPEMFSLIFGGHGLRLSVLDSTTPEAVLRQRARLDLSQTLFIVSSKSGSTVETHAFFKYFYNETCAALGVTQAGAHFVAITDPGSRLGRWAEQYGFRATLVNDPNIGGRYSALSQFGLAPAALVGVDVRLYLQRALEMAALCDLRQVSAENNPAAVLGTLIAVAAAQGRDKLTLILPEAWLSFGDWVEQLVAESVGKEGKGVLPVVGETLAAPDQYGADRLFVAFQLDGDPTQTAAVAALETAGQPVIRLGLRDAYDLAGEMYRWELATAILGYHLEINPFDQPNVEEAKKLARAAVKAYAETGRLPQPTPTLAEGGITVYGPTTAQEAGTALRRFLAQGEPGDYVALQAYLPPSAATSQQLAALRQAVRDRTRLATTLGYGPRFLHSTGQLHKGDAGRGLFVVLSYDPEQDAAIPDEAGAETSTLSFGVLLRPQVLGDIQALEQNGRRVLRFHFGRNVADGLQRLWQALQEEVENV